MVTTNRARGTKVSVKPRIAGLLCLAVACVAPALAGPTGVIEVNRSFPLIALPDSVTGQPVTLASFRGKRVVLHVFASW